MVFHCYKKRKESLKWKNITDLILKNAKYLWLNIEDAYKFCDSLYALITLPFLHIRMSCPTALNKDSKFTYFWTQMRCFEYEIGKTFSNIKILCYYSNRS